MDFFLLLNKFMQKLYLKCYFQHWGGGGGAAPHPRARPPILNFPKGYHDVQSRRLLTSMGKYQELSVLEFIGTTVRFRGIILEGSRTEFNVRSPSPPSGYDVSNTFVVAWFIYT